MSYADQHKSWPMISILSAGFAALAFWASQSELDQLVRATGQVIPDARTQIIQAADGGVLFALNVQEGQAVKAGQTLAVLEKERAQAGFKEVVARVASLRAMPEVRLLQSVSGAYDLIAVGVVPSVDGMDLLTDRIGAIDGVERTTSSIVLSTKFER